MKPIPITHQINQKALELLEQNPGGIRWTDLNAQIKTAFPDFHPKTINGCVWKLVEKYPQKVHKPKTGVFQLLKYQSID
jgi:Mg2+/Co2+ transporter CorB